MSLKKRVNEIHLQYFPQIYVVTKNVYEYFFFCLNKASDFYFEKKRFRKKTGYSLHLENPRSFNEKIIWKKVHDRNPLLPKTADKFGVRSYVKEVLGKEEGEKILIPLLYVTDNSDSIPFDTLPKDFVIKANHGNGWNIIVRDGVFDKREILKRCKVWLKVPYGLEKVEWGYKDIDRRIIIEKFLLDKNGEIPNDFKFFVFAGRCKMIQVDFDRFEHHTRSLFDEQWNYLDVSLRFPKGKNIEKPVQFEKMKKIAEKLGENFDFVRVDFYTLDDKMYIGEMTHYPGTGNEEFKPRSKDFELGEEFEIKPKYWKN
jgi:hypothetical protein